MTSGDKGKKSEEGKWVCKALTDVDFFISSSMIP